MNGWLLTLAIAAVRGWTWLYTLPLDLPVQEARRAEIASDLWECQHDGSRHGSGGPRAAHLLIRAWLGIPDDLCWGWEQLQVHPLCTRHLWMTVRIAVVGIAASTLAVSASGPVVNLTPHLLQVNVVSTGWMAVGSSRLDATLVPALSFTVTNMADRPLGALQVNALFYQSGHTYRSGGSAFLYAVGSRGLASGATSRSLLVRPHGEAQATAADALRPRATLQPSALSPSRVKLFVKHDGRWTLLGDYAVQRRLLGLGPQI